jgi:hypothetical protein
MKRVRRVCKGRRTIAPWLRNVCMRVKYHLRTLSCGPADSLWIAPTLVADYDPEGKRPGVEHSSALTHHVRQLL